MNTPTQNISAYTLKSLVEKLRPNRFPGITGVMAAMIGFILGASFVHPSITEISVTSDGRVLAEADGEIATKRVIGSYADVLQCWLGLISVAGLTREEYMEAQGLFAARVGFFGIPTA